jgi:hypothetical protein
MISRLASARPRHGAVAVAARRAYRVTSVTPAPQGRLRLFVKVRLIGEILLSYTLTRWRMPRFDIRELVRVSRLDGLASPVIDQPISIDEWRVALRLGQAVTRTLGILPTDSRCLVQALVLTRLLSARGIANQLVIGAHSSPEFEAHAWIEHKGRPVLPPQGFHDSRLLEL